MQLKTNRNAILVYHQRNGHGRIHEFLGIVKMVWRHCLVYSYGDTGEFVISIYIAVAGISFATYVVTTSRVVLLINMHLITPNGIYQYRFTVCKHLSICYSER